jgi:hypothetical protein
MVGITNLNGTSGSNRQILFADFREWNNLALIRIVNQIGSACPENRMKARIVIAPILQIEELNTAIVVKWHYIADPSLRRFPEEPVGHPHWLFWSSSGFGLHSGRISGSGRGLPGLLNIRSRSLASRTAAGRQQQDERQCCAPLSFFGNS